MRRYSHGLTAPQCTLDMSHAVGAADGFGANHDRV